MNKPTKSHLYVGAAACALLAAGCGGEAGTGSQLAIRFQVIPAARDTVILGPTEYESGKAPAPRARVDGGVLRVAGYFETPCNGEKVTGSARMDGETVRVRIEARRKEGACPMMWDPYVYEGQLHSLTAGTHHVIVEHIRDARRGTGVVLDTVVVLQDGSQ